MPISPDNSPEKKPTHREPGFDLETTMRGIEAEIQKDSGIEPALELPLPSIRGIYRAQVVCGLPRPRRRYPKA